MPLRAHAYLVALALPWVPLCSAQSIIATIAGSRFTFPANPVPALNAPLGIVTAVAADGQGNVYVADANNNRVFRIDSSGALSTFAGSGVNGYSGDGGPATSAALSSPACLAFDLNGNLYVCDTGNFRLRKITPGGTITTLAGNGARGNSGDGGPALQASFGTDTRLAIDRLVNIYVSDADNHRVRIITRDGNINAFAGNGIDASSGDGGSALQASFQAPQGLAFDNAGNLYVADGPGEDVRRITPGGIISTVAGTGFYGENGDGGPAIKARLNFPAGVAVDQNSALYIADNVGNTIRRVDPSGTISTIAGANQVGLAGDGGPAASASLYSPLDLAFSTAGALLVADSQNFRIRSIAGGTITTVAGNGNFRYAGDGGVATNANLPFPSGVVVDSAGNVNICDNFANRVRTVNAFGIINLRAGTNAPGFSGDGGPAISAQLTNCEGVALDSAGNLYLADTFNRRIRKITAAGIISTVAGNGLNSFSGDGGPAVNAALSGPEGVAVDAQGNIYIADTLNERVRKVSSSGVITTIAGDGTAGYTGDGVPSNASQLNTPRRLALDSSGNLYIADSGNNVVREIVAATGIIRTVAGKTTNGYSGDGGPAIAAALSDPHGMAIDASGALLIADSGNQVIRRVDSNGVITTIAGNGSSTLSGDGRPPLSTGFGFPADVSVDSAGNIYIADRGNARVRRIQPAPASLVVSQTGLTFSAAVDAAAVATRTISILNGGAGTIGWSAIASTVSGGTNWLSVSPAQGTSTNSAAGVLTVTANPAGLAEGNYYGRIQIVSPGVTNSPRLLTVVLNILSAAQTSGAAVNPAGLVFTGTAGGGNPPAQTLRISKLHGAAVSFTSSILFGQPGQWVAAAPGTGSVSSALPATITLTPSLTGLAAGAYTATLNLKFSDGSARSVPLALSLGSGLAIGSNPQSRRLLAEPCTPTRLVPVVTAFGSGFSLPAGWPVAIQAQVVDDCGDNVGAGTVVATFSNGDPPLALAAQGGGTWSGTWEPRAATPNEVITITAQAGIAGTAQVTGLITTNAEPPILNAGGILSSASFSAGTPVAPGGIVSIFGSNLASSTAQATTLPLPTTLGGAQVLIGGVPMPLLYAFPGQINAVVPFDVAVGGAQVIVQNGNALSVPEPTLISAAGPGTFTVNGSGTGAGIVVNGSGFELGPSVPAHAGGAVVIYCTGLGGVQNAIDAGNAAPLSPLAPANDVVSVTMGGVAAQVLFAGLVPNLSGLYQVNAVIPTGVTGASVPLVISVSGVSSAAVTVPIQ